ncbi:MAG TPA: MDR family MFS transporter [Acidothermaceae bacterium]|jgi:EmrB/QacA subfamily drug resistance transporter|nr:MDR family MFS transporter [Acidothermaceae bacterium]
MSGATSTSVTGGPAAAPGVGGFTHRQVLTILTGLMLGMFLAALDQNIVATAIRTIGDDLHGLSVQAWVTTAYLITSTVSTPLYGKLSDLYGRKPFFLIAITIFITGSAACAFATSMYMLAAFRAYQGLGAGGLFSLALAIIGDIVSPRDRAKYQGYFLAVFGTASVLGPVLGGFFAGSGSILSITGWRWVFLVNVPIGIVALYVVWRTLNLPNVHRPASIDWVGVGSLFVCLVPLLVVAEQGQKWGWGSGTSLLCYGLGIAGLVLFILAEHRMGDDALIPLRFFQNRVFSLTSIVGVLVGMGLFGGISVLPLYLQIVRGVSPTESGLLLIPLTAGLMVGAIISGQLISRTGRYKIFPIVGSALCVVALVLMSFIGADTPLWQTDLYGALFGVGIGNIMQPITLATQNAMPARDIGVATSSATFFRQMGGTLGVAVFLSVLFSTAGGNIAHAYKNAAKSPSFVALKTDPTITSAPGNKPLLSLLNGQKLSSSSLNDTSFLKHADKRLAHPFFVGFSNSMDVIFLLAAAVMLIGFLVLLAVEELPLRTMSGIQAQQQDAQDARAAAAILDEGHEAEASGSPGVEATPT